MKTVINVKANKDVKEDAQKLAEELGLSLSVVINAFLKEFVRNRSVVFSTIPRMSKELENLLGGVEKDIKKKKNLSRSLTSRKEVFEYLNAL